MFAYHLVSFITLGKHNVNSVFLYQTFILLFIELFHKEIHCVDAALFLLHRVMFHLFSQLLQKHQKMQHESKKIQHLLCTSFIAAFVF